MVAMIETLKAQADQAQAEQTQPERLKIIPIGERAFDAPQPIEYLIEGLTPRESINVIVGDAGSGKTYAVLDMAVCVALGKQWLDHETRQATVLIVDEESGERRLTRRLHEVLNGHLVKREEAPQIFATCLQGFDARNLDDINALQIAILQTGAGLVIIDALMEVTPGAEENSVKDMLPALHNLRRVAECTNSAFWIIHHNNKNGGYRGTSAIKGKVDNMLMVEKPKGSKFMTFSAEKNRDVEERTFTALATWVSDPPQFYLTATEIERRQHLTDSERYVLKFLSANLEATADDVANSADVCAPETARRTLHRLVASKHAERTNAGTGRGNKATFQLTDKGKDAIKGDE